MATFTGTTSNETITPDDRVFDRSGGSRPAAGRRRQPTASMAVAVPILLTPAAATTRSLSRRRRQRCPRRARNDTIALHVPDGTVSARRRRGGSDVVTFDLASGPAVGSYSGRIDLHGGDGKDDLKRQRRDQLQHRRSRTSTYTCMVKEETTGSRRLFRIRVPDYVPYERREQRRVSLWRHRGRHLRRPGTAGRRHREAWGGIRHR